MIFLIEMFWLPLLLAACLGVAIGWVTCRNDSVRGALNWPLVALVIFFAGLVAASQFGLPGRPGLWLETALSMFAAYIAGCCVGCMGKRLLAQRSVPASAATNTPINALAGATERLDHADGVAAQPAETTLGVVTASTGATGAPHTTSGAVGSRAPVVGATPTLLTAPRNGQKDDLSLIWGVAEKLELRMNRMGIWHFDQIANWSPDHVKWFEHEVEGFRGRLDRDKWIEQCKKLATGWRPETAVGQRSTGLD